MKINKEKLEKQLKSILKYLLISLGILFVIGLMMPSTPTVEEEVQAVIDEHENSPEYKKNYVIFRESFMSGCVVEPEYEKYCECAFNFSYEEYGLDVMLELDNFPSEVKERIINRISNACLHNL